MLAKKIKKLLCELPCLRKVLCALLRLSNENRDLTSMLFCKRVLRQSGERSRKLNMGFAKVIFSRESSRLICYITCIGNGTLVSLLTVVFSDRQLQHRSQVYSLPKLRSITRATKNKYFGISVCPTHLRVFAKVLRKFAKVFAKDGLPYPEVASCVLKYVVLYTLFSQLDEDPPQQPKSRKV